MNIKRPIEVTLGEDQDEKAVLRSLRAALEIGVGVVIKNPGGLEPSFLIRPEEVAIHLRRRRMAAAAPALVRALLAAEWQGDRQTHERCPVCRATHEQGHQRECAIETALTAAGLAMQSERDAVRPVVLPRSSPPRAGG